MWERVDSSERLSSCFSFGARDGVVMENCVSLLPCTEEDSENTSNEPDHE